MTVEAQRSEVLAQKPRGWAKAGAVGEVELPSCSALAGDEADEKETRQESKVEDEDSPRLF